MSILAGPFERNVVQTKTKDDEEEDLLVFGYACKLYRDDAKALMEESGQLLIPWMGDHSLMVDRYDVRNRLEDKNKFGLKSNLPHRPTVEEVELEEELDQERYLALENDDIRVAEQEEEEKKRKQESSFSAVGFSYANIAPSSVSRKEEEDEDPPLLACYPQQLEHPPTSSVDQGGDGEEEYIPPPGLIIPANIKPPATMKLHSIIEKTALFVVKQGAQMEIIIKAKQKYNPFFSFLNHDDELFPYYQHVKAMLTRGAYVPRQVSPAPPPPKHERDSPERTNGIVRVAKGGVEERGDRGANGVVRDDRTTSGEPQTESDKSVESGNDKDEEESSEDESDSDDEGGYLHPLLMGGALKNSSKSSTPTPGTREASPAIQNTTTATCTTPSTITTNTEAYTTSSIAFYSKRLSVNSAPLIDTRTTPSESPRVATSSSAMNRNGNGTDQHPLQYSYGSGTDQHVNPQLLSEAANSGAYSDQYAHSYGHQTHGEYSDAYSSQHNHQYTQDGDGYYDGGTATVDGTAQYDYQAYYYHQSAADGAVQYDGSAMPTTAPPPPPAPEDLPVVTKTAEYVAKNGDAFERTVIERHAGDPRFGFLNPWDKGHAYYQMLKQQHRQRLAYEAYSSQMGWNQYPGMGMGPGPGPGAQPPPLSSYETNKENIVSEPTNLQRLSETGAVSFKLQPKSAKSAFDPSSLVDLGTAEDTGEGDEGQWSTEEDGPPPAKKPRAEWNSNNKMGTKVEEFLSTVKALIGTE